MMRQKPRSALRRLGPACALAVLAAIGLAPRAGHAACAHWRKIDIGVAVTPPNVVHTVPYIAQALGMFAKYCIKPHIIQFDGGDSPAAVAAVTQGTAISMLSEVPIERGMHAKLIWGMVPVLPMSYYVSAGIKTAADLKGKRLSAAGGGVGGLNWLIGRAVLQSAGLTVHDATFIASTTAGRLPGLVAGQVDGVVLHPEDGYLAHKANPGLHPLVKLSKLLPDWQFNSYGASDAFIAKHFKLLRDTVAAMMDAARAIYTEPAKVIPIMVKATGKPRAAVEFAWKEETGDCIWAVNTGLDPKRIEWTHRYDMANHDAPAGKALAFGQIVDTRLVAAALAEAGGPVNIHGCHS